MTQDTVTALSGVSPGTARRLDGSALGIQTFCDDKTMPANP